VVSSSRRSDSTTETTSALVIKAWACAGVRLAAKPLKVTL
jgi:hypothetical protein